MLICCGVMQNVFALPLYNYVVSQADRNACLFSSRNVSEMI